MEIWEKTSRLGGKALTASMPYIKLDMRSLVEYYRTQLAKRGIPVRYLTEADHDNVAAFSPDAVIWAAGGASIMPKSIAGIDGENVFTCDEALENLTPVGNRVVIVGAGLVGVESALHFAQTGRTVILIEMEEKVLPAPPFMQNETWLREALAASSVTVLCRTRLTAVTPEGACVEDEAGKRVLSCDTVLMALGYSGSAQLADRLSDICPVYPIGDAVEARNIMAAVEEVYEAVARL